MVKGQVEIITKIHEFSTQGEIDIIDLTPSISTFVADSGISEGKVTVFVNGSTGAVSTTEYEPRLTEDNKRIMNELVPKGQGYRHDEIDSNAHSHLRATLLGSDVSIPISESRLLLGTWQQVVFFELDVRKRRRTVVFQIIGIQ
jgi:secondary thiamine-phosphate synthase enzyme